MAKDYSKKSPEQIIKIDGKNCFVEIMNSSFELGKIKFHFAEYDVNQQKGGRITNEIDYYLGIPEFLVLCQEVVSGGLHKKIVTEKATLNDQKKYANAVETWQGGTSANSLKFQNRSRSDGMCEARLLKIVPGLKAYCMLQAEKGPGVESDTGLIIPKFANGRPEACVRVPMEYTTLLGALETVKFHLQAFLSARYAQGAFTYVGTNTNNGAAVGSENPFVQNDEWH